MKNDKTFVHFSTNYVNIYKIKDNDIILLKHQQIFFNETLINEKLFKKIDNFLINLRNIIDEVDNSTVRLYATGVFQDFSKEEQQQLIIHVFVNSGLYFNIIQPDLERFYLEKSYQLTGKRDIFKGLTRQEFRKIVICGSFQKI